MEMQGWCEQYLDLHGPELPEAMADRHAQELAAARAAAIVLAGERDSYRQQYEDAYAEARIDPLTGLPNRRALDEYLAQLDNQQDTDFAVGVLDIDKFKQVNDQEGHDIGDDVLVDIATRVRTMLKSSDFVARTGGDEFTLVLRGLKPELFTTVAQLIQIRILDYTEGERGFTTKHGLNVSVGFAHRSSASDVAAVTQIADEAMYTMKHRRSQPPEYSI